MMHISIERLRNWLLAGAGLLLIVIAAFLGYAHRRAHQYLKNLPGRLGADITRESNGFTYSQSGKGGRTIYTIHAAKLVQYKDGKTTLRDVGIVLYGQRQDRADRIYGSEFEYDQRAGLVRAMGVVHLDLQAPAPVDARSRGEYASGREPVSGNTVRSGEEQSGEHHADDERMVHVKTSGLVFLQRLGVASTDQEIEFEYNGLNGRAKGADYNSDTGVTVLQSDVRVSGLRDGQPVMLTASHAEMDRGKGEMTLDRARYVAVGDGERTKGSGRTVTAERAVVHLRRDGSVERVTGSGGVSLTQGAGVLRGEVGEVEVSAASRPKTAQISGGLNYTEDGVLRQVRGRAGQGHARFNEQGRVEDAVMSVAAEMHVRERSAEGGRWSERTVSGERIDLMFATATGLGQSGGDGGRRAGGRQWLRDVMTTGGARMLLVDRSDKGEETTSELRGDSLSAMSVWDGRSARLTHVTGAGHTGLRRSDAEGGVDTSEGETLEVSLGASPQRGGGKAVSANGAGAVQGATAVIRAEQSGGVTLTHLPPKAVGREAIKLDGKKTDGSGLIRATASRARYEADGQTLTMAGQAQVTEGESLLRADTVTLRRDTGDATAEGSVKASYRQVASAEAVHVMASRADFKHEAGQAIFYGSAGVPARLWQGASQVQAPVLEFSQGERTLVARTNGPRDQVQTVLVGGGGKSDAAGLRKGPQVIRVASRSLRYSDGERRAQFGGGVVLEDASGTVRGSQVVVLLRPDGAANAKQSSAEAGQAGFLGGSVDRVTAEGAVEVSEAGRRGQGERLVYTAGDGMFVLTGTPAMPPKVVDEVQGTITGAALRFHAGDNSVMVVGDAKDGEGQRVRTETQVRQHR